MIKNIFSFVVLALTSFLFSCAPQSDQNSTGRPKQDQVTEEAVNLLSSNIWCQQNTTTGATEYRWIFDKNFKVTSTQVSSQLQESYTWTINTNNVLVVFLAPEVPLFTKQVFYSYNVNIHKRTMIWKDSTAPDLINFIECE
ncbi:hypothetical protein [Pseudobdellovibrio sp. HCB154]|uniref:hypothetical protein n=1 Tax=Pseudobdellovibrio sp. HCB154 TaxID=3386277 RepID=UPI0039175268